MEGNWKRVARKVEAVRETVWAQLQVDVPRYRNSEFEPQLIKKGQTRFYGFDDKIIPMSSRGMTCREIQAHHKEIYKVSPDLISTVTGAVIDEVRTWQARHLDEVCPLLYLNVLKVKIRDTGKPVLLQRDSDEVQGCFVASLN